MCPKVRNNGVLDDGILGCQRRGPKNGAGSLLRSTTFWSRLGSTGDIHAVRHGFMHHFRLLLSQSGYYGGRSGWLHVVNVNVGADKGCKGVGDQLLQMRLLQWKAKLQ